MTARVMVMNAKYGEIDYQDVDDSLLDDRIVHLIVESESLSDETIEDLQEFAERECFTLDITHIHDKSDGANWYYDEQDIVTLREDDRISDILYKALVQVETF